MACSVCGKIQVGRCEGGWIEYLAATNVCPNNPDKTLQPRLKPDYIMPAMLGSLPEWENDPRFGKPFEEAEKAKAAAEDDMWTIQPEPSAKGLEDLL